MTYPIPADALDDRLAITGTSGAGKTYAVLGALARILKRGSRIVAADPLGVMWGLRLMPDGVTPSPFKPVIFGGPHGDLPLTVGAAALIGETAATMSESAILDLSELGSAAAERRFMLAFLTAMFRHANRDPVHIILDEADLWAPQKLFDKEGDAAKLLGMTQNIVRRGRVKGFIPWLITQRPAVLSKDVLSQADGVVAMKLTASQDRDAIGAWIEGQADRAKEKETLALLPTMDLGEGVIWIPGRGILKTARFPENSTFDSSRTPKRGEVKRKVDLKPLDLGKLKDRLGKVEAEAKANDPAALKARIAQLEKEAKAKPVAAPHEPDMGAIQNARNAGEAAGIKVSYPRGFEDGFENARAMIWDAVCHLANDTADQYRKRTFKMGKVVIPADLARSIQSDTKPAKTISIPAPPVRDFARVPFIKPGDVILSGVQQKILDALAELAAMGTRTPTREIAAFMAGYTNLTSKGFANAMGSLKTGGFIEYPGSGLVGLTDAGIAQANEPRTAMTTDGIRERIVGMLGGASGKILDPLIAAYPGALQRDDVAASAGYGNKTSKGFANAIGRLRTLGFIEYPSGGEIRATSVLFP